MRVFKKWSVAIIRVTLVPMLYCSAWLRQWMLAQGARLVHTNLPGAEACARPPVRLR